MSPDDPIAQALDTEYQDAAQNPLRAEAIMKMLPRLVGAENPVKTYSGLPTTGQEVFADVASGAGNAPSGIPGDSQFRGPDLGSIYAGRAARAQSADVANAANEVGRANRAIQLLGQMAKTEGRWEPVADAAGRVIAQRNTQTGEIKATGIEKPETHTVSPDQVLVGANGQVLYRAKGKPDVQVVEGLFADKATGQFRNADGKTLTADEVMEHIHKLAQARSAKNSQVTNIDLKQDTAAAKKMGEEDVTLLTGETQKALGAIAQIQNIHRIREALDSGRAVTGTGATKRLSLVRLADTLGIAGKSDREKMARTQTAIQGMAQTELDAAAQLRGQGQITEKERELIRATASGDIGSAESEIRSRLDALEKVSRIRIKNQQRLRGQFAETYPDVRGGMHNIAEPPEYTRPGGTPGFTDQQEQRLQELLRKQGAAQ